MTSAGSAASFCTPVPLNPKNLNPDVRLPYGLTAMEVFSAMQEFQDFLGFINNQLHTQGIERLETMLMPANFSSLVGEFMVSSIPKHSDVLVKNAYHNGYPDLIPAGRFAGDSVQYGDEGIEVKSSRYAKGWQGHNEEEGWLMVFVFDSNRPVDADKGVAPKSFKIEGVYTDRLSKSDWRFSGRSGSSRRTITASVLPEAAKRMHENYVYRA